jgi:aryl-alcohol dehydrogenase-like predicted oxidoreductase
MSGRTMNYRLLGRSGVRVSELCLGTMTFGEDWGWGADKATSRELYDAFRAAGGNFFDTANRYTEGTSERFLGEFCASERDQVVIATKFTLWTRRDDPNASGNHRKNMVQALEASLKRLGTDYVDLYWVHAWDFTTSPEELMRGLDDLVRAGKVLYVGVSDTPAWVVSRAITLAELRGWTPFTALQLKYSLLERTAERDLLPMARALDLAVTPWSILGGGLLTGKYRRGEADAGDRLARSGSAARVDARSQGIVDEVLAVAGEVGCSASQVAIAWLRSRPGVILPLVGARRPEQLADNLGALAVTLDAAQLERLDAASAIALGFPHDFLAQDYVRDLVFGGCQDRIVNHRQR